MLFIAPEELKEDEMHYKGKWKGEDGTNITIREGGTADFDKDSTSVSLGASSIENDTLTIEQFGFLEYNFQINQKPREIDSEMVMILDNEEFIKKQE